MSTLAVIPTQAGISFKDRTQIIMRMMMSYDK